jgi:hypothetical protein
MNPQPTLYGDSSAAAGAGIFGGFMGIVWLVFLVLVIVAYWKIFTKAGEAGWKSIIPIYNVIILLKIVGRPWWWLILMLIPIVQLVIVFIVMMDLSKSFGHGIGFALGLFFLSVIFFLILGFNGDRYIGPGGVAPAAPAPAYTPPAPPM